LRKFNIPHNFEFTSIITFMPSGSAKASSRSTDWNKDLKIKFTAQDPCNIVRKIGTNKMADDMRFVIKTVVGEENFIDMVPNGDPTITAAAAAAAPCRPALPINAGLRQGQIRPDHGHRRPPM
jgi:hypothetical protein